MFFDAHACVSLVVYETFTANCCFSYQSTPNYLIRIACHFFGHVFFAMQHVFVQYSPFSMVASSLVSAQLYD
jgi:hypothetical protein